MMLKEDQGDGGTGDQETNRLGGFLLFAGSDAEEVQWVSARCRRESRRLERLLLCLILAVDGRSDSE